MEATKLTRFRVLCLFSALPLINFFALIIFPILNMVKIKRFTLEIFIYFMLPIGACLIGIVFLSNYIFPLFTVSNEFITGLIGFLIWLALTTAFSIISLAIHLLFLRITLNSDDFKAFMAKRQKPVKNDASDVGNFPN